MARRSVASSLARSYQRNLRALTKVVTKATVANGRRIGAKIARDVVAKNRPPPGPGDWLPGVAVGPAGARGFHLYRPPGVLAGEKLPLMVMLHGCGQTGRDFAVSTRMNRLADRDRFMVL